MFEDRRQQIRFAAGPDTLVEVRYGRMSRKVRVSDISWDGVRIEDPPPLPEGGRVQVRVFWSDMQRFGDWVDCQVAWQNEKAAGLKFIDNREGD